MKITSFVKKVLFFAAVLFSSFQLYSADFSLSGWKTHSSLLDISSGAIDSKGTYWLGTVGGAFSYEPKNGIFTYYNNLNGLLSLDLHSTTVNPATNDILFGGSNGNIDILKSDSSWLHIADIKNSQFTEPQINDVVFRDKYAFIAGGFGISMFDTERNVFVKTPPRFGNFPANTGVKKAVILNGRLWVATKYGIASVDLNNSIIIPDNWTNYTEVNGLKDNDVLSLSEHQNELYAATKNAIYKMEGDSFRVIATIPDWDMFKGLTFYKGTLTYATAFYVNTIDNKNLYNKDQIIDSAMINSIVSDGNTLLVFLSESGFYEITEAGGRHIRPNSPVSSLFAGITVDSRGVLWNATGTQWLGKGIAAMENEIWTNYIRILHPLLASNFYYRAASNDRGDVFFSSWGAGFAHFFRDGDSYKFTRYDTANSPLMGVTNDRNFIVTGQVATDALSGLTWIVNYSPNSKGPLLVALDQSGKFYSYENTLNAYNRDFIPMAIDNYGTKWLGSTNTGTTGLYFFNEMGTPENTSDDKSGTYSTSNTSLPNSTINCMATDKSGVVWIGTPSGAAVILNPSAALRNGNPIIRKVSILSPININDIMIDAINQKWLATNEGVWIINADGTDVIGYISTKNSPLLSDEVISLATDQNSGRVYLGTKIGMTSVNTLSIKPLTNFDIKVYPQPFHPEKDILLSIEGLSSDAEISIVTSSGEPVKKLSTTSRKAVWDGTDKYGNPASTGVYLILTASESSELTSVGKFVLIRE